MRLVSFAEWRQDIPVLSHWTYLDTAQRGLTPQAVTQAGVAQLEAWQDLDQEKGIRELKANVRADIARLLQVDEDEVAFVGSTGQGLNTIAGAFPWQPGDNVVLSGTEHPSNLYPWTNLRLRGVEVRLVPSEDGSLHPEDFRPYIDGRTRMVAASLVSFYPGGLLPAAQLADVAHRHGAYLVLDVIQAIGILPVYPGQIGADAVAAAAYKGLMTPFGSGFMYISNQLAAKLRPEHLYIPGVVGEMGVVGGTLTDPDYRLKPGAALYEPGWNNLVGLGQMQQSLQTILEIGVERIAQHVRALARQLASGARDLGYRLDTPEGQLANIVCLRLADAPSLVQFLGERKIKASARRHGLRMALHGYNDQVDVDRTLEALAEYRRKRG
ncbi:MAG: aminotransferase class V-fold PLP-dependent enzyme [Bacillota bacterium]|jgi:cysteine desulfurase/selenocysteine lyase